MQGVRRYSQNTKGENKTLEAQANDLEFRSMRENLQFHGMFQSTHEDCEAIVKTFIKEKIDIPQDIIIDREISEHLKTLKQGVGCSRQKQYNRKEEIYPLRTIVKKQLEKL